jgi:hypothetical protein
MITHAQFSEQVIDIALAILGAPVDIAAWSTKGWNAHTDTSRSGIKLDFPAQAWALVALPKVDLTVRAIDAAGLQWLNPASTLHAVAAASTPKHHACWIVCVFPR